MELPMILHPLPFQTDFSQVVGHLYLSHIPCGFPSPADDYLEPPLSLDQLFKESPSTYFLKASGHSMKDKGILDGAILVVDRSASFADGDTVVAAVDGQLTCKMVDTVNQQLVSANPDFPPIAITCDMDVIIQGVVKWAVNPL
jgi:DNA polymerase V